jgi:hypothetical protein
MMIFPYSFAMCIYVKAVSNAFHAHYSAYYNTVKIILYLNAKQRYLQAVAAAEYITLLSFIFIAK